MLALATYGYGIGMVLLTVFVLGRAMRLSLKLAVLAFCLIVPPLFVWTIAPYVPHYGFALVLAAAMAPLINLFGLFVGGIWHVMWRKMSRRVRS